MSGRDPNLKSLIQESIELLCMGLGNDQKNLETVASLVEAPDENAVLFKKPDVRHQLGYLQGLADGLNMTVGEMLDEFAEEPSQKDEETDDSCPECSGTGIGRSGPPDTSRCDGCRGTGVRRAEPEYEPDDRD